MVIKNRSARRSLHRLITILALWAILVSGLIATATAVEGSGNCEHGYVSDLQINASAMTAKAIPDFQFNAEQTSYNITLLDSSAGTIQLTVSETVPVDGTYGFSIFVGENRVQTAKITKRPQNIQLALTYAKLQMGQVNQVYFRVGKFVDTKSSVTDYDEYVFSSQMKPSFSSLSVSDEAGAITTSPAFEMGMCYFTNTFTAFSEKSTIEIKFKYNSTKGVSCYLDEAHTIDYTSNQKKSISLQDYYIDGTSIAKVPIYLAYEKDDVKLDNTFYLYIAHPSSFSPSITSQPEGVTCEKGDTPQLSVSALDPDENNDLTFQWYRGRSVSVMGAISGATNATYQVPASDTLSAGTMYYRCDITNKINDDIFGELEFTVRSETIAVNINLTYVSPPKILYELGSFATTESNTFSNNYRTVYNAGEKFDLMYFAIEPPEEGVEISYDFYCSAVPNFQTATILETEQKAGRSGSDFTGADLNQRFETYCGKPTSGFEEGRYYIWCVITATAEDGRSAQTTSGPVCLEFKQLSLDFEKGSGTKTDPYIIESESDFSKIREYVNNGQWCPGVYFKMNNDIELSDAWTPIGVRKDLTPDADESVKQYKIEAFSGILDGDGHKLTVAEGGKPLFNYVSDAIIRNLNIFGKKIAGNGLIDKSFTDYGADGDYWTGVPNCVTLENIRLLSGSSTLQSGFMEGSGSGANTITIRNCTVEDNVIIGYDKNENGIGSFVGPAFNGQIENSSSSATVYGHHYVGGLAGKKGQAVGLCDVRNSCFLGTVKATGDWAGGIIGAGYYSDSAPNTVPVSIQNCYVVADITANNYIGGLFGGEQGLKAAINQCWLTDNYFYGTVTATTTDTAYCGGIIGWYESINDIQHITNNYYYEKAGNATGLIGGVGKYWLDESEIGEITNRMGSAKTPEEFKNGTVKDLLNAGSDYRNWVQGELYPVHSSAAYLTGLTLSGEYKTVYQVGEELDLTGLVAKATWSDGTETDVALDDLTVTGFDSSKAAKLILNVAYEGASAKIVIRVEEDFEPADTSVQVKFSVSHDDSFVAGEGSGEVAALYELDVPYFDLGLYGLEDYYYGGTATSANGNVTMLHLFLYATEVIECGYEESEAGQGLLYEEGLLGTTSGKLTLTGGSGAMYMTNFWGYDQNSSYYLNYAYPLRNETIGETADQIVLNDGDVVTLGHFSNWDFYTDAASGYNYIKTNAEQDTVEQGQSVELSVYRTKLQNYQTTQIPVEAVLDVYYTSTDNVSEDFANWEKLTTDASGKLTVDTSKLEVGEYIFAVAGQMGSTVNAICSAPGGVILTVEKNEEDTKPTDPVTPVDPVIPSEPSKPTTPTEPTEPETPVAGMNFSDVSTGDWFYEDVAYVYAAGLMNGMGNGKFAPDVTTTRGMIVTILYRLEGEPPVSGSCPFGDVNSGSYYEKAIAWAAANDIVNGYGNSSFGPNDPITREQMAVILCRYAQYKKLDVSVGEDTNILSFHDVSEISEYAFSAMQWACGDGIMQGDNGNLMPRGNATRAQIAALLLHRFCEEILK